MAHTTEYQTDFWSPIWVKEGLLVLYLFRKIFCTLSISFYKITKIVRALWLAEGRVCMRVCKLVEMFCFSRAHQASTNSTSLYFIYFIYPKKQELITCASLRVQDFAIGKNFSFNQCHYKEFCVFSRESYFRKATENFFSRVCVAWYKHLRGWENSEQLCKPSTSSRVCINVANSPYPSSVDIRLCKHGKVCYCLNGIIYYSFKIFPRFWLLKAHA